MGGLFYEFFYRIKSGRGLGPCDLVPRGIESLRIRYSQGEFFVAKSLVEDLVEAGVHFGHRASRWNPKMARFIYARKNLIHIVDIRETVRGLLRARKYLRDVAAKGSLVLFVGTKRQAGSPIEREAARCGMPYVSERWLGGCLTNFRTIRSRLGRLEELESIIQGDEIASYSKKMQAALNREYRKMYRNLNGIRHMDRIPECVFVIDPNKEKNAIREARKLNITTVALIDTDCDPDEVDLPIPGNDDGIRSIEAILKHMVDAVEEGKAQRQAAAKDSKKAEKPSAPKAAAEPPADAEPAATKPPAETPPAETPAAETPAEE